MFILLNYCTVFLFFKKSRKQNGGRDSASSSLYKYKL